MSSRSAGLTRTELTVAFAIVALTAAVAVPSALSNRIAANEASAVASLREIAAAQEKFKAAVYCDVDQDGVGEYGLLRELTGAVGVRTSSSAGSVRALLDVPLLPRGYDRINRFSECERAGYLLRILLPDALGVAVPEVASGPLRAALDTDLTESSWCCYAWPRSHGRTGRRTFFTNQDRILVATDAAEYSGRGSVRGHPEWRGQDWVGAYNAGAAFAAPGSMWKMTGAVATGTVGRDGNLWRPVPDRQSDVDRSVRGRLASVPAGRRRDGSFLMDVHLGLNETRETLIVRFPATGFVTPPELVLIDASGAATPIPSRQRVRAYVSGDRATVDRTAELRFDTSSQFLPEGVGSLTDFGGGTIEVRADGAAVFRGHVPQFTTPTGANLPGASASYRATATLSHVREGFPGSGVVAVELTNRPSGTLGRVRIRVHDLDLYPYDVLTMKNGGGFQFFRQVRRRGRTHDGVFNFNEHSGDSCPFEHITKFSEATIEIRTEAGGLVLSGTFPLIE